MSTDRYGIGVVVNYCTNEYPFLAACLRELQPFATRVVVPVCDRFFDGAAEDAALLERGARENAGLADFRLWHWDPAHNDGSCGQFYWEGHARWLGVEALGNCEFVLFLDADEVIESARFAQWLDSFRVSFQADGREWELSYRQLDAFKLAAYWYFREPGLRARAIEHAGVMARRSRLTREIVISPGARNTLFQNTPGIHATAVMGLDGRPMVHHYSWVRSREQMLRKVRGWGHRGQRNWERLVEAEFARPEFSGVDFVHGYTYDRVEPYVPIELASP